MPRLFRYRATYTITLAVLFWAGIALILNAIGVL